MYHPWRALRRLVDWTLHIRPLPPGLLGVTDFQRREITMAPGQSQAQRRSTIAHELVHVERGPAPPLWRAQDERRTMVEAAYRLISLEDLLDALRWARTWAELADELWVDEESVRIRMKHLHPSERAHLVDALGGDEGHR